MPGIPDTSVSKTNNTLSRLSLLVIYIYSWQLLWHFPLRFPSSKRWQRPAYWTWTRWLLRLNGFKFSFKTCWVLIKKRKESVKKFMIKQRQYCGLLDEAVTTRRFQNWFRCPVSSFSVVLLSLLLIFFNTVDSAYKAEKPMGTMGEKLYFYHV